MFDLEEVFDPRILGLPLDGEQVKQGGSIDLAGKEASWLSTIKLEPDLETTIATPTATPSKVSMADANFTTNPTRRTALDLLRELAPIGFDFHTAPMASSDVSVKVETIDAIDTIDAGDARSDTTLVGHVDKQLESDLKPVVSPRRFQARLVRTRLQRSRRSRVGIRIIRALPGYPDIALDEVSSQPELNLEIAPPEVVVIKEEEEPVKPVHPLLYDIAETFGTDTSDQILRESKQYATSGYPLPPTIRNLFPALDHLPTAVSFANTVRAHLGLEKLVLGKKNRIQILRQVARMREQLYLNLVSSLILPHAPVLEEEEIAEETAEAIQLTPGNLDVVAAKLPKVFPKDKATIKAGMPFAMGELAGRVLWNNGVGTIVGAEGGFRGKVSDGDVHVFVDQYVYPAVPHLCVYRLRSLTVGSACGHTPYLIPSSCPYSSPY